MDPLLTDLEQVSSPHLSDDGHINIHRESYNIQSLANTFNLQWTETPSAKEQIKSRLKTEFACSSECLKARVLGFLPFISILGAYQWKAWLLLDFVSGISVGVIHIPQGMGFALLTSVPPVYGLYSSLFPVVLYFFFGTSRHISMGTMALISLMIGAVVDRELDKLGLTTDVSQLSENLTANETLDMISQAERLQVDIALSVSLMVGITQLLMGLVGLGVIASFMSMPFVNSFMAGAAAHIIMSQIPGLFGIKLKRRLGIFTIPLSLYDIFSHIKETNICALVTGVTCIILLFLLKEVVNEKFKSRMKVPIPAELIIVVLATIVSHFSALNDRYDLRIVGVIPKGFPAPRVPPLTNATTYIGDAILIAIISFAISISMSKLMADKHKYKIDVTQELYAYGICHTVGAFLNCFAGAQAPPRTIVHDSVGGKTQVGSIVSSILLLLVCLVIGPLFRALPITVLAAIIIVALLPLFRQFKDLERIGHISAPDLVVWIITFTSVVVLDLTIGLAIGLGVSVFVIAINDKLATGTALVSIDNTELYVVSDRLLPSNRVSQIPTIKIFRFQSSLYFVNIDKFKAELFEKAENCQQLLQERPKFEEPDITLDVSNGADGKPAAYNTNGERRNGTTMTGGTSPSSTASTRAIIVDCSLISYIDLMGVNLLKSLVADYQQVGIRLVLAECTSSVLTKLQAADILQTEAGDRSKIEVFPLVQDAVASLNTRTLNNTSTEL